MQLDAGSRRLARHALAWYDVTPTRLTLVAESFNTVFRVATDEGPFALRIGPRQRIHADGTEAAEAAWQKRLRAHGIPAPRIHPTRDGAASTRVADDRSCVLIDWVMGRSLQRRLTAASARRLGQLAARLHRDAADWSAGASFDVLHGDQVLYWRLPPKVVTVTRRFCGTLFADALARAQSVVDALWRDAPQPPHLLHGDLTPANVIVTDRGLVPIDFQDMIVGFGIQDLANSISALGRQPDAHRLVDDFRAGYVEAHPWPDASPALLESLVIARRLNQMNLTLPHVRASELSEYVASRTALLREWMRSPTGL